MPPTLTVFLHGRDNKPIEVEDNTTPKKPECNGPSAVRENGMKGITSGKCSKQAGKKYGGSNAGKF